LGDCSMLTMVNSDQSRVGEAQRSCETVLC